MGRGHRSLDTGAGNSVKERYLPEAERRLRDILLAFKRGEDVAPALNFRTEGFFEAGVFLGLVTEQQLSELLARLQREVLDIADQRLLADQLSIPVMMRRAPGIP